MALKVGELFATMNLKDEGFSSGLSKMGKLFGGSLVGMTTAAAAAGGVAMKSIVNTGKSFEAAMSEVQAISGATGKELEMLSQTAKEYGSTTSFTASESAEALKYMALAGWDATQSAAALPGVLNLAAASGMELGTASDYVTDYISAFGMKCEEATYLADLMAKAQATSNTSAMQLGEAYKNCAANMHSAGQDVETTTSLLMSMADQGLKGAEAGTALAAIQRDITQKMENGAIKIGQTSVAVADANGNFRDMTEIMRDVESATQGMGTAEKNAALLSTFTARSIKGVNLLLNAGVDSAANYESSLRGAAGTAADQAATMLDNLEGDVTIFKSALEGLQIDLYESMNGMMREGVQGATSLVQQLQTAFQQGMNPAALEGVLDSAFDLLGNFGSKAGDMVANITDAFARVAPRLAKGLSRGLSEVLGKVGRQMPKLAKNLFSALPDVLGAAGDLLPDLADSLFETLGGVVEQVIGDLPRLVPEIANGLGKMFLSAVKGLNSLFGGLEKGIWDALGKAGLRDLTLEEVWQQQFDNTDTSQIDMGKGLVTYSFETEVDPGNYQEEINTAVQTIHDALQNIPEISEDQRAAIEEAIMAGSGADALETALSALEVPDAAGIASQITEALNTISGALSGLGLSEDAQAKILEVQTSGGDVAAALEAYGVDPATAQTVAQTISDASGKIDGAVSGLNLDPRALATLKTRATTSKGQITAALQLLGLSDADIATITSSYDTVSGTLTAQYTGLFDDIATALTNGIPDENDPALAQAKAKLEQYLQQAYEKIQQWKDAKLQELQNSGLTGDALAEEVANVEEQANSMVENVNQMGAAATQFIDDNAGKATSVVQENLGQLQEIAGQAQALNAQIDGMVASALSSGQNLNRSAVEQGLVGDQSGQIEAINYSAQELQYALEQANQKAAAALEKAQTDFAGDTEGYAAERARIMSELGEAESNAYEVYNQHMARIIAGIAQSNPELAKQLMEFGQRNEFTGMAEKLQQGLFDAFSKGEPIDVNQLLQNIGFTEADLGALAEELDLEPSELVDKINYALGQALVDGGGNSEIEGMLRDYIYEGLTGADLAGAITNGDIDISGINEVFKYALENGLLTDAEAQQWATDSVGTLIQALGNLQFDENGNIITPPLTVAPEPTVQEGTGEKINKAVEDATETSNGSTIAEPEIIVDPNVTPAEGTSEQITEAVEESTQGTGEATTVEPEVTVKPNAKPAEGAQQEVSDAMDTVTGEEAPPVEMTMDVNASVGNISFTEGSSITDRLAALFTEQSIPLAMNIEASVGSVTFAEGSGITEQLTALVTEQSIPLAVNITASIASVALAEGTDLLASVTALLPTEAPSVNVSAAATLSLSSVTLAEGTSLQSAVDSLLASQALSVALTASAALTISLTSSNASSVGQTEGAALSSGVASGISSGSGGVTSAASSLISSAAASMRSATSGASAIGRAFAAGLASGISAGRSGVVSAAVSIAQAAAAAARSALAIHSPSRVTEEMGSLFDAGFAKGIIGSAKMAVRSASSLASMAANAATVRRLSPSVGFTGGTSSGSSNVNVNIDYDALADAMNQRQMVLTMDNRKLAEVQERETARVQNARSKSVAMGYGHR